MTDLTASQFRPQGDQLTSTPTTVQIIPRTFQGIQHRFLQNQNREERDLKFKRIKGKREETYNRRFAGGHHPTTNRPACGFSMVNSLVDVT